MLIGYAVKLIAIIILYLYMYLDNKRRDREAASTSSAAATAAAGGPEDQDAIEKGMLVRQILLLSLFFFSLLWIKLTNFV